MQKRYDTIILQMRLSFGSFSQTEMFTFKTDWKRCVIKQFLRWRQKDVRQMLLFSVTIRFADQKVKNYLFSFLTLDDFSLQSYTGYFAREIDSIFYGFAHIFSVFFFQFSGSFPEE